MLMGKDAVDEKREYDIKWTANAMYIGPRPPFPLLVSST